MRFEKITDGFGALEAPRVDRHNNLYFSDMMFGGLRKRHGDGSSETFLAEREHIGGLVFNQDGRLICSGKGGLILFDEHSGTVEPLLTEIDGFPLEVVNDIQTDAEGGIYGGAIDFTSLAEGRPPAYGFLFRLDPSGEATVLARDVGVSNGLGFSPDGGRLYHADTSIGIRVYPLSAGRVCGDAELFAAMPGVDGLAVDALGGVWVACYSTAEVCRFHPDGRLDKKVGFDDPLVLSLCFGGPDLRDLYVVTAGQFHEPEKRLGAVYRARSDVAGLPLPLARF